MKKANSFSVGWVVGPYLHKRFLGGKYIKFDDVGKITTEFRRRYYNVEPRLVKAPPQRNCDYLYVIRVKHWFSTDTYTYDVRGSREKGAGKTDSLAWIDAIELYDAAINP